MGNSCSGAEPRVDEAKFIDRSIKTEPPAIPQQTHTKQAPSPPKPKEVRASTEGKKPTINNVLGNSPTEDIKTVFDISKVLGKGQFGTTRLAVEKKTGVNYACKSISKRKLTSLEDLEDIRREVQVMYHLAGHPSIVKIHSTYEDKQHVHIVMELCTGGELFDRIVERVHYTERDAAECFRTMASVVAHCHSMGVLHRDLKPENFLLSDKSKNSPIKATDFGLSVFFKEGQVFTDIVGSAYYVAPEVLKRKYSKEADVWSCGVILYILLCGVPPFCGDTEEQIFQNVIHQGVDFDSSPWPNISAAAKDVVSKLLVRDPTKRVSAAEILRHDWVRADGVASDKPLELEVLKRIRGFADMNHFKKHALKVIAANLPADEISGLRELFESMDSDKSGTITVDEMREGLRAKGTKIPEAELQAIMDNADVNGDGTIDYEEFLAATIHLNKLEQEEHLYHAFTYFDTDSSGYITREELGAALGKHSNDSLRHIEQIIDEVDKDRDGKIDYGEFCVMMRSGNEGLLNAARSVKRGVMRHKEM